MNRRKSQYGFTILETLIVLIVLTAVLSSGAVYMKYNADNNLNRSAAENLQQLTAATQWYAKDNFESLISAGTSDVQLSTLTTGKYLNTLFSKKNSYGQQYKITIAKDDNAQAGKGTLSVIITTQGGDNISLDNLRKIVSQAGNAAGYAEKSGAIIGNQGGWHYDTAINHGHLASLSFVSANDIVSAETFLRRDKFDGHPEWNRMNTALDMNSNNIEFDSGAVVFKHDNYDAILAANGGTFSHESDKTEITPSAIKLSNGDINLSGSAITALTVKPGVTLLRLGLDIYTAADRICDNDSDDSIGKLFVVGFKDTVPRYTFMCGKNDGYSKVPKKGRAYYVFGAKAAATQETCDTQYWIPSDINSDHPTDNKERACKKSVSSDSRNAIITYLEYVGQKEVHKFYTKGGGGTGLACRHNRFRTQKTNVCIIRSKTLTESIPGEGLPELERHNDWQCNAGSFKGTGGNPHNIYLIEYDGQDPDSCDRVKYHS